MQTFKKISLVLLVLILVACAPKEKDTSKAATVILMPIPSPASTNTVVYGSGSLSISEVDSDAEKFGFQEGCIITLNITVPDPETVANKKFTVVTDKWEIDLYPSRESAIITECTYNDFSRATVMDGNLKCEVKGYQFVCPEEAWK